MSDEMAHGSFSLSSPGSILFVDKTYCVVPMADLVVEYLLHQKKPAIPRRLMLLDAGRGLNKGSAHTAPE